MIEPYPDIGYRPVRFTLWNCPEPKSVVFEDGDILVSVENVCWDEDDTRRWGWRYTVLRRVVEDE